MAQSDTSSQLEFLSFEDLLETNSQETDEEMVKIATQTLRPIRESPGIISIITKEDIEISGAQDLMEVLRLVPGIDFGSDVQNVIGISIRGKWASEGKVLITMNGQIMNETSYGSFSFAQSINIDHIERVEIIRGPGSAIYGGVAGLAVINIVTKTGEEIQGISTSHSLSFAGGRAKQSQELQQAQIHNQILEKEKMTQVLKMAEQELENENQKKKVIQQQLIAETIKAKVAQQQKKLLEANYEKELQAKQLKEAETQSQLRLSVIILMLLLLMVSILLIIHSNKARKKLAQQNIFIQNQHSEIILKNIHITEQNKELTQVQEEILLKSQSLSEQNIKLSEAQQIIEIQHQQMMSYMESLEEQVLDRTKQLTDLNQELVKNNQQLEQFGFIVAHNLRGPVARLLGLSTIFQMSPGTEEEKVFLVTKIQQEITMLDTVISDLNIILQIKKGIENEVTNLKLDEKLIHVMDNIKEDIKESGSSITYNFSEANNIKFIQPYLHSILYNLISNAIKYRSPDRAPEIRLSTTRLNEQTVCLKVEDNGLGMDLNLHGKNIFGLYKRFHLHKEGKGLGLYLVKTQMEILGGRIDIESTPNQGTTFFLYFKHAESKLLTLV